MAAPPPRWAFAALIAGNAALALGALLVRLADTGPVAAAFWRLALALPLMLVLARRESARMPPRGVIAVAAGAGVFFALDLAAWHLGIERTKIANATLFGNSASLMLVVYGIWLARRRPQGAEAWAILLALAGALLLMGQSYEASRDFLVGDLLSLLAGVLYCAYVVMMSRARGSIGVWTALAIASAAGAPILLGTAAALGEAILPGDWRPLIALALTSQLIGQGLLIAALPHFRPLVIGLSLLIQPAISALTGWAWLGETLGWIEVLGSVLVGAALVLIHSRPR